MTKKDLNWLKNEIYTEMMHLEPDRKERWSDVKYQTLRSVAQKLNQLDKSVTISIDKEQLIKNIENYIPLHDKTVGDVVDGILKTVKQLPEMEVLSQEWIDKHKESRINNLRKRTTSYVVTVEKLQNLLVPKQEITYEDALKVIAENIDTDKFSVGLYIEALNNNEKYEFLTDKWIHEHAKAVTYDGIPDQSEIVYVDDLENLIITKQELPVIPKYVAEVIEEHKELGYDVYHSIDLIIETNGEGVPSISNWVVINIDKYARAWLDGHTIASDEEEPLYRVSAADMRSGFWFLCKDNDGDIMIGTNKDYYRVGWDSFKLTEQEIKDYDPRYMAFAIPVEEDGDAVAVSNKD